MKFSDLYYPGFTSHVLSRETEKMVICIPDWCIKCLLYSPALTRYTFILHLINPQSQVFQEGIWFVHSIISPRISHINRLTRSEFQVNCLLKSFHINFVMHGQNDRQPNILKQFEQFSSILMVQTHIVIYTHCLVSSFCFSQQLEPKVPSQCTACVWPVNTDTSTQIIQQLTKLKNRL